MDGNGKVRYYKIQSDEYTVIREDINHILDSIETTQGDGVYPITISRMLTDTNSYYEIHTDLIYILKKNDLNVFLVDPIGYGIQLDSKFNTLDAGERHSYIFPILCDMDDKLCPLTFICTNTGQLLDVYSVNQEFYINKTVSWMNGYSSDINGMLLDFHEVMQSTADYRDEQLRMKYADVQKMLATGELSEAIAENPYEDLLYDEGYYQEKSHNPNLTGD